MIKKEFEVLYHDFPNLRFETPFMTRAKMLKYVTPEGKIISKGKSLRLSRYMRISNVIETVNGQLRFDVPSRWIDPFEKLFYQNPVRIGDKKFYVVCLCFIHDVNNGGESLWHVHGNIQNNGQIDPSDCMIRATFDIQTLCKGLAKANSEITFYLAAIDYSLSRDEILKQNVSYATIEEFIGKMLLKRQAFSYEHEVRLFAVSEKPFTIDNDFCLMNLKKAKQVVTSVTLPPLPILNNYNKKDYHKQLEQQLSRLRCDLRNNGYNMKIQQSRLYDVMR